jgi:uncharacterized repeat protein (TIGR04076 family)
MTHPMVPCRVTVLKRGFNQDLIDEFLEEQSQNIGLCECFDDGQEFVIEDFGAAPEGFCPYAWADIRTNLFTIAMGANVPGIRQPGTMLASCTDWFRPVLFKIERIEDE